MATTLQTQKTTWDAGVASELEFWDAYIGAKGLTWPAHYLNTCDPNLPLQPRPAALLSGTANPRVLDVGSGPLTFLGKYHEGNRVDITAVDPLADDYAKILEKHQVVPLVKTQKVAAEELSHKFPSDTFDLVYARNCIDHSYNPEVAILEMIKVAKKGCYVLMEHVQNEAEHQNYGGFHQWNFSAAKDGSFLIRSKSAEVNMTEKYQELAAIQCEVTNIEGEGDLGDNEDQKAQNVT